MITSPKRPISLYSWNVNGLRAVLKKNFFEFMEKMQPDILGLQETKAMESQVIGPLEPLQGYHRVFSSAEKKGYSGVAIFSRERPLSVSVTLDHPDIDREGRVIRADFGNFILFNVYFPNGKARPERLKYKMDFYAHFLGIVGKLVQEGKKVIVCGDVNTAHCSIDLARPKENQTVSGFLPEERAWMDDFLKAGFVDIFRQFHPEPNQYTWWDMKSGARARNIGWRIDYFFVSESMRKQVVNASILPEIQGSDHCPIMIELNL